MAALLDYDAIIVGGGCAGLACCADLCAAGLRCVVFEARDALGGRVRSLEGCHGEVHDAGAAWVHGDDPRNPQVRLAAAARVGLEGTFPGNPWCVGEVFRRRAVFFRRGGRVDAATVAAGGAAHGAAERRVAAAAAAACASADADATYGGALDYGDCGDGDVLFVARAHAAIRAGKG